MQEAKWLCPNRCQLSQMFCIITTVGVCSSNIFLYIRNHNSVVDVGLLQEYFNLSCYRTYMPINLLRKFRGVPPGNMNSDGHKFSFIHQQTYETVTFHGK